MFVEKLIAKFKEEHSWYMVECLAAFVKQFSDVSKANIAVQQGLFDLNRYPYIYSAYSTAK